MSNLISPETARQFDSLPPSALDAERALLASLMLVGDGDAFDEMRAALGAREAFYQADHQIIYDHLCGLRADGKGIDVLLLRERLSTAGLLGEIGGAAYLGEILSSVPSAAHGAHYAGIVREKYGLRRLIAVSNDMLREAYAPTDLNDKSDSLCRKAIDELMLIRRSSSGMRIRSLQDVLIDLIAELDDPTPPQIPFGLRDLDVMVKGAGLGLMTVVAGRPGSGKSLFGKNAILNMARAGRRCGIVTIEESERKIGGDYLSGVTGIVNSNIHSRDVSDGQVAMLIDATADLARLPIYIAEEPASLDEVEAVIIGMVAKHRCEAVVVDYLQLIQSPDDNQYVRITRISKALKRLGKRLGIALIVLAQLSRKNETGGVRKPMMSDLRDSGGIEEDGDLILLLHREDYYRKSQAGYIPDCQLECIVAKQKIGPTGTVPLLFDGARQLISDWNRD